MANPKVMRFKGRGRGRHEDIFETLKAAGSAGLRIEQLEEHHGFTRTVVLRAMSKLGIRVELMTHEPLRYRVRTPAKVAPLREAWIVTRSRDERKLAGKNRLPVATMVVYDRFELPRALVRLSRLHPSELEAREADPNALDVLELAGLLERITGDLFEVCPYELIS